MTSSVESYENFQWPEREFFNFATDVVDEWATHPENLAAIRAVDNTDEDRSISYRALSDRSKSVAAMLANAGVARGDFVLVILGRDVAWWEVVTACLRAGFVAAPATTQLSAKDIAYRVAAAKAVAIVTDIECARKVDSVLGECPTLRARIVVGDTREGWIDYATASSDAPPVFEAAATRCDEQALCYFTSGTTGSPKMVVHNHGYCLAHMTTGRYWLNLQPGDLHWNIADTGWAKAAWSSYFGPWHCGATVLVHSGRQIDPGQAIAMLQTLPVKSMCAAPTLYRMLVQQDLSSFAAPALRSCIGAGEPLNEEVISIWREATGVTIRDGYGQTESVILCGSLPGTEVRLGSMGRPAPGFDLAIVDSDGRELPAGEEGNLAVRVKPNRPLGLFRGYDSDTTSAGPSFVGDWYFTGDRAKCDADGYFWFIARADDVIISSGYRIGPFEVESALIEHPAVSESAVVASPDELRGEIVKAFVVLAQGFEPDNGLAKELQDHVKAVTAPYKYPRKIEFVASLPKTVSGKIRRNELRRMEWKQSGGKAH